MKKVLFILNEFDASGVSKSLLNYLELFDRKKMSIDLLLFNRNGQWEYLIPNDVKLLFAFDKSPEKGGIISRYLFGFLFAIYPKIYLSRVLNLKLYDVIIDYKGQYPSVFKTVNCYKITWIHGDLSLNTNLVEKENAIKNSHKLSYKFKQSMRKRGFVDTDMIICVSKTMKQHFVERYGFENKTTFQPNIIILNDYKKLSSDIESMRIKNQGIFKFCCISRISAGKGIERLLHATKKLNEIGYIFHVYIVGSGDTFDEMYNMKNQLNIENVDFIGHLENPHQVLFFSDVFLCPSLTEAAPTAVFEAFLMNKAILTTDVGNVKEFLHSGIDSLIVENADDSFFKGMQYFLDNKHVINQFENKLKQTTIKYNYIEVASSIDKLISEGVEKNNEI